MSSTKKRPRDSKLDVVLVCCGEPKKSMGWFHLTQLLADERVTVSAVVEPWFLGPGAEKPGADKFAELRASTEGVLFCSSIDEVPQRVDQAAPRLFLLAGRTCDAPRLFAAAIERGASHVYIEKPGAETAADLETMQQLADAKGVQVVVGYNKNVAAYAREACAVLRERQDGDGPLPQVTLEHCNAFAPGDELNDFLRGPGGEGMLHNMCCHELALAATLFGVECTRLRRVTLDPQRSELVELGEGRADWQRVTFRMELDAHASPPAGCVPLTELTLTADRCGGNFSRIRLSDKAEGEAGGEAPAVSDFRLPTVEQEARILEAQAADPEIRPYFLQQAPDYERLKSVFVGHILDGKPGIPTGVVGLDGAIEALRLADLLKGVLKQCSVKKVHTWEPPALRA